MDANYFSNQCNESENPDDWGWFITLDLDVNPPTTNPPSTKIPIPICDYDTNKKTDSSKKNICELYKNFLIYGLFYSCIYIDYLYKYIINPYSCYKQKISN